MRGRATPPATGVDWRKPNPEEDKPGSRSRAERVREARAERAERGERAGSRKPGAQLVASAQPRSAAKSKTGILHLRVNRRIARMMKVNPKKKNPNFQVVTIHKTLPCPTADNPEAKSKREAESLEPNSRSAPSPHPASSAPSEASAHAASALVRALLPRSCAIQWSRVRCSGPAVPTRFQWSP
jgi:hypothetical protein